MDEYPNTSQIPEDECCICGSYDIACADPFGYPFCGEHDHRAELLKRGRKHNWPALRVVGKTCTYAIDNDVESYLLTVLCGTDDRVFELIEAIDEYEENQAKAS